MTAWTDLVKKIYSENKSKKGYKLGHAMKAAKKVYKTMKRDSKKMRKTKKRGGEPEPTKEPLKMAGGEPEPTKEPVMMAGGEPEPTKEPIKMGGRRKRRN
uniref:Uncharacterized protein n=1 Tax=viral metagenome TaxID=1070528 RepID=A0A6C0B6V3_9ZZZZ